MPEPRELLIFSDDWGRHPSSCQHLAKELLTRRKITWVNTIGTRTPGFDLSTLSRGREKLADWLRPRAAAPDAPANLRIANPIMWPWFTRGHEQRLNRALLRRQLIPLLQSQERAPIAVTTVPLIADMVGLLPVAGWVYYCVDDFSEWPGLDHRVLAKMERRLVERADNIAAVSETLRTKIKAWGRDSHLLTHGVDLAMWQGAGASAGGADGIPAGLPRPWHVFWGLIDRRLDLDFLGHLCRTMTEGTVILVGPELNPDPALNSLPRLVRVGARPLTSLPGIAAAADVLIMPYTDAPVTRAINPLKMKEYLATGKPAVVRRLPAVEPWLDCLDAVETAEQFAVAVQQRAKQGVTDEQRRARIRLEHETWAHKAVQFEQLLDEVAVSASGADQQAGTVIA